MTVAEGAQTIVDVMEELQRQGVWIRGIRVDWRSEVEFERCAQASRKDSRRGVAGGRSVKLSELIAALTGLLEEYGDQPEVLMDTDGSGYGTVEAVVFKDVGAGKRVLIR